MLRKVSATVASREKVIPHCSTFRTPDVPNIRPANSNWRRGPNGARNSSSTPSRRRIEVLAADPAAYADDRYHYLWAWLDRDRGHIRSRMFANEPGVPEDEATGSAAVRLTGHLRRDLTVTQGRGSQILTTWHPEGWVSVQGGVVSDGVRLGAQPPSVAAQADSIVPVMPFVPRSREWSAIEIKLVRPRVDELLSHFESAIGADFPGYRNHVYRTITYAMHFLDGAAEDERLVETAMVYHDMTSGCGPIMSWPTWNRRKP